MLHGKELLCYCIFFFFNDTATTEIYTLSLHDALPIANQSSRHCAHYHRRVFDGGQKARQFGAVLYKIERPIRACSPLLAR